MRAAWCSAFVIAVAGVVLAGPVSAQPIVKPGDRAEPERGSGQPATGDAAEPERTWPMRPWEAEPIDVEVVGEHPLDEERHIGEYAQPRWTARRRFPTTRTYVVPAGMIELEWWFRYHAPLADPHESRELRSELEFSMGLGHRLQFDLYLGGEQIGPEGDFGINTEKVELRYAFADWGEIWANPTIYLEWAHHNAGPDALEFKLLLGGGLARGWHGAMNLIYERALSGEEQEGEYAISAGVSRTVVDSVFSIGLETKVEVVDFAGARFDFVEQEYLLGPSFMWSPVQPANILLVPLFGVGRSVPEDKTESLLEAWLVAGWVF